MDVLAAILDPRKARGKLYFWTLRPTLLAARLVSGHQNAHTIAQWATNLVAAGWLGVYC